MHMEQEIVHANAILFIIIKEMSDSPSECNTINNYLAFSKSNSWFVQDLCKKN